MRPVNRSLVLAALLVTTLCAPVRAQSLSLSGMVVRGSAASPVEDARVYLHHGTLDIGPSITDAAGRYAFYDTAPGTYRLRVEINGQIVLNRTVTVPGRITPLAVP